jgi:hypothetical protein
VKIGSDTVYTLDPDAVNAAVDWLRKRVAAPATASPSKR